MLPNKERKKSVCVRSCMYPIGIGHIIMEADKSQDP